MPTARPRSGALQLLPLAMIVACAKPAPVVVAPAMDVEQESLRTEMATELPRPQRIDFDWRVSEEGLRLSGSGVARVEPPYRARLDLFLGNGERVAAAALVGSDLRLPPGIGAQFIPPEHLLWGTLGVFRPGLGTALLGGETIDGQLRMRFRLENLDEVHYYMVDRRVLRVDMLRGGNVIQDVRLTRDETGVPLEAVYRDLTAFRQLTISRKGVENVEPYPPDVWTPGMGGPDGDSTPAPDDRL